MNLEPADPDLEELAYTLNSLSSRNRLYTFLELHEGNSAKRIAYELDVTRNALQPYITDWKELGLIESEGMEYKFTEKGEMVVNLLCEFYGRDQ